MEFKNAMKANYEKLCKENEGPALAHKEKGNQLVAADNFIGASQEYTTAMKALLPDYPCSFLHVLFANRAMCALKLGWLKEAEEDATSCLDLVSAQNLMVFPKAYYRRGLARQQLGNLAGAQEDLETALRHMPTDSAVTAALADLKSQIVGSKKSDSVLDPWALAVADPLGSREQTSRPD